MHRVKSWRDKELFLIGGNGTRDRAHLHVDRQVSVGENSMSYVANTPAPDGIKSPVALPEHLPLNQESPTTGRRSAHGRPLSNRKLSVTMVMQVLMAPAVSVLVSTVLSLLSLALLLLLCVIRKKRRMEGTYRPSAEERKQTGSGGAKNQACLSRCLKRNASYDRRLEMDPPSVPV
ncbi:hypothetical protein F7725_016141 [Dissostichus mawsoni]|uniref:Uncharacterized protein n=1 Tax=Dissostichus mawsoni TaxID=36200 RepID=A0A7J5Y4N8_DISMA|nr:hypothetical protein F7725_016141 [Dissostichus mawsoni]